MNNFTSALLLICLVAAVSLAGVWAMDKSAENHERKIAEHRKEMKP